MLGKAERNRNERKNQERKKYNFIQQGKRRNERKLCEQENFYFEKGEVNKCEEYSLFFQIYLRNVRIFAGIK